MKQIAERKALEKLVEFDKPFNDYRTLYPVITLNEDAMGQND